MIVQHEWELRKAKRLSVWVKFGRWDRLSTVLTVERKWPGRAGWSVIIADQAVALDECWGVKKAKRLAEAKLAEKINEIQAEAMKLAQEVFDEC